MDAYSAQLNEESPTSRLGRDYLRRRCLARTDVVEPYRLGVVTDPLPGDEEYRGRLVIPYLTLAGVRALKFRCIEAHNCKDEGHPKYTQPHGQPQRLYNAPAYFGGHDRIGFTEGEIDAITATVHLGLPTFGVPGATQWDKNGYFWELIPRDFAEIVVFADGDLPGKQFASKVANSAGPSSRIVFCEDGSDVNDMVCRGLGDELKRKAGL